jgi:putative ABC transport system permease protein
MKDIGYRTALRQDVSFTLRQFRRSPGASVLAVVLLALGIGAATIVFSVVSAVVLDAVPFDDADGLVVIRELTPQGDFFSTSEPNYLDWAERQRAFDGLAAYTLGDVTWTGGDRAERLIGLRVSHTLFGVLGVRPVTGRLPTEAEDEPGTASRVVVLSEGAWRDRFGADEGAVGRWIQLDGVRHLVIGVVDTEAGFPGVEVFTPLRPDPSSDRTNHMLQTVARLAPGGTVAGARSDMRRIAAELAAEYPDANEGWSATVAPLREYRVGDRLARISTFLLLAVGLLLLMACGSVATMLVARASGRQREIGLRAALGAGRERILAQLLTESAVLGLLGAALGVFLAWLGTPLVRELGPSDLARLGLASVDARVLGVALAVSIVAVLLFGLAPAVFATRGPLHRALREGGGSVSRAHRRVLGGLVVGQFALAVVVAIGAGLTARSFARIQAVDLGFEPEGVLQFSVGLPEEEFSEAQRLAFLETLEVQIAGLPGVETVGASMTSPFSQFQASNFVAAGDNVPDRQDEFVPVSWRAVDGGFFAAGGVRILGGRVFNALADFEPSVIIDEGLARELWGTAEATGRVVVWGDPAGSRMRVVGVVNSLHDERVEGPPRPRIYLPYSLFPWPSPSVLVRSAGDPAALAPRIREIVHELNAAVPVTDMATLPSLTSEAVAWPRFTMQVVSAFALMAVLLAGAGIYGVAALTVQRRRRELGIRVALGAEPATITRLVLRDAARLAMLGIAIGVAFAVATAGVFNAILYDLAPHDPATFTVLPLALAAIALLASWAPARRAARVDPLEALSAE